MDRNQKLALKDRCIEETVTKASWSALIFLQTNLNLMHRLLWFQLNMLRKNAFSAQELQLDHEDLNKLKSALMIDALSKLMVILESIFALCNCIRLGEIKQLPSTLAGYEQKYVSDFTGVVRTGKLKAELIGILLGYPDIKLQGLKQEEEKILSEYFDISIKEVDKVLSRLAVFYQQNLNVYNKFKHGLSFICGLQMRLTRDGEESPTNVVLALDRRKKAPSGDILPGRFTLSDGVDWFNTITIVPFHKWTLEQYEAIAGDAIYLVNLIVNGQLTKAENCSDTYLPVSVGQDGKAQLVLVRSQDFGNERLSKIESIAQSLANNMIVSAKRGAAFQFDLDDSLLTKVAAKLNSNVAATIWKPQ